MSWGWASFHYGRWGWERDLGWFWVPGTVWGPCWVTWRSSDIYMGWAPLPPGVRFVPGVGIRRIGVAIPARYWIFVDGPYFLNPSLYRYVFPYERNVTIINYTVHQTNIFVRNNRIVNEGIGYDRARRITKQTITKHSIKDVQKADQRRMGAGTVEVYRPKINKNQAAKPKTIVRRENAKARLTEVQTTVKKTAKKESAAERDETMKELHEREVRLLEQSQKKEIRELERQKEERKRSVRTETDKAKVEKEHKNKVLKLQKSHETEKTQIKKRHETEKKVTKKKESEKKETKKKVKKKIKK